MFKKLKLGIIIFCLTILLSGCKFNKDSMEGINIYTTIYPVNYLIDNLYGNYSTIHSIYPTGINPCEYSLPEKKLKEYASTDLFIFNSLDKDRDIAVDMININKNLKIIDISLGMTYENDIAELWLNPYNYLMMAQNVKNGLLEYVTNPYLISNNKKTGIEDKYNELKYNLSRLDADIKEDIKLAKYKTIVVDDDMFNFLNKYDLNIISLEENKNLSDNKVNEVKKLIKDGKIKYIYSANKETNETCKKLLKDENIELITLNAMKSIDGGITNSNESYITVMNNNLDLINKELYK